MSADAPRQRTSLHRVDGRQEPRPLRGLEKVARIYGRVKCGDVMMAWDYAKECALPEGELLADRNRWAESERARWLHGALPPIDPKLSDGGAWRGSCEGGAKKEATDVEQRLARTGRLRT